MPIITHVFKTYFPDTHGGLEEAIRQIGKYSISKGFEVRVVSVSKVPRENELEGIKCKSYLFSLGSSSMPVSIDMAKDFARIVKETDILHLHFPYPYGELLTLFTRVKKPIVVTFHCEIRNRVFLRVCYEPFIRILMKKVNVIVPTSTNLLNSTPILKRYKQKTKVINLWLDKTRFESISDVDVSFRSKIEKLGQYALFTGVLRWYKGLDFLLDAAKNVKGNIVIVGKGPLKETIEKRIREENLTNVYMLGFLSDSELCYVLRKCRFFVLPSISPAEAFGQVLLEASYFSKAMITTELGTGTSYVNLHNETGFVVPPRNNVELQKAMNILFLDNILCENMGKNAFVRYESIFREEIQGEKYVNLYNRLLS